MGKSTIERVAAGEGGVMGSFQEFHAPVHSPMNLRLLHLTRSLPLVGTTLSPAGAAERAPPERFMGRLSVPVPEAIASWIGTALPS